VIKRQLQSFAADRPGLLLEDKGFAIALHYRLAPDRAGEVAEIMGRMARLGGEELSLQPGKMVIELRPSSANKARALTRLMAKPPFKGRRPVAVGDDLTDVDLLTQATRQGGLAVRVGKAIAVPDAHAELADPAAVRSWLARLAEQA
jgi:trehalose 6-phosphate phosphatase